LTPREYNVALLLVDGSIGEVAIALGIARATVDTHRTSIYRKLGIHHRHELRPALLRFALRESFSIDG
jgi:DNA-binding CsgD family transcriptional regulator